MQLISPDKIKHALIGLAVAAGCTFFFGWKIGLLAGVGVSVAIEAFQWSINELLERKPALEGKLWFLEIRCPDYKDAIAGCAGSAAGVIIAMFILAQQGTQ